MAGTPKNYSTTDIIQGPGDAWIIGAAPLDSVVRLTLASDGTPDATAHPGSYHLGGVMGAISTAIKPKLSEISMDQYDAPVDTRVTELDGKITATLEQLESQKLQWSLGVGTYAAIASPGYKQVTFGGTTLVPQTCVAVISPSRNNPGMYVVSVLFKAVPMGGYSFGLGRAKAAEYKAEFSGLSDLTRTVGQMTGVIYQTLVAPVGGTPTAKNTTVTEIYQGPADLWMLGIAPTDAAMRVTLDAATLTPSSTVHAGSLTLGLTEGATTFSVVPKIEMIKADQADGAVDAYLASITAKIEATVLEGSMDKLARALGVGNYSISAGQYAQATFGGTLLNPTLCIATIGVKQAVLPAPAAALNAVVGCLYRVNAADGITWQASRTKASSYKVTFSGQADVTRTAGRTVGIFHEMI